RQHFQHTNNGRGLLTSLKEATALSIARRGSSAPAERRGRTYDKALPLQIGRVVFYGLGHWHGRVAMSSLVGLARRRRPACWPHHYKEAVMADEKKVPDGPGRPPPKTKPVSVQLKDLPDFSDEKTPLDEYCHRHRDKLSEAYLAEVAESLRE